MTANVALTDTFDEWRVKTNEIIVGTQTDGMSNFLKVLDTTNSTSNATGSIITSGGVGIAKSVTIGENLTVHGNTVIDGDTTISGNLVFGDADTDQVTFSADINSDIIPNANLTFNVGNTLNMWANTYTGALDVIQKSDSGKPAITVTSTDVDQIGISVVASQTTADVLDIAADAVTTAKVIDITADALTTGSALYIDDNSAITGVGGTRNTVDILQNNAAALAATALKVQSDGGITGITLDKNYTDVAAATVTGLHVDFDRTVPGSGTATFTDIGINLDVNAAGLGTTTTTGLDIDVVGATSGTHTAVGIDVNVSGADTMYAAKFVGGDILVGVDGTGHDVTFYGDTASQYMMWDQSADELVLALDSKLSFWDAAGGENIIASADGHLEVNAGTTLDITAPTVDINASTLVQVTGPITVGVDDTGHDVKLFGATAGSFMLWNQATDSLHLTDDSPIKVGDAQDMTLYHDGTNSYITNAVGALKVATETSGIAVTIGHTTSVVTISDNLTVTDTITESSMREMKDNIEPIENILPAVLQLQGVTFDWKKDKNNDKRSNHYGFIAEDVHEVLPSLVSYSPEGIPIGVQYSKMTAVLLEAIKEQQVQIDELKSKLN
jgi:hypothetical protein